MPQAGGLALAGHVQLHITRRCTESNVSTVWTRTNFAAWMRAATVCSVIGDVAKYDKLPLPRLLRD